MLSSLYGLRFCVNSLFESVQTILINVRSFSQDNISATRQSQEITYGGCRSRTVTVVLSNTSLRRWQVLLLTANAVIIRILPLAAYCQQLRQRLSIQPPGIPAPACALLIQPVAGFSVIQRLLQRIFFSMYSLGIKFGRWKVFVVGGQIDRIH